MERLTKWIEGLEEYDVISVLKRVVDRLEEQG